MRALRRYLTALVCLLPVGRAKRPLLRVLGHRLAPGARIGCSLVLAERMWLGAGARIGAFNVISARRLLLRPRARIGRMNVIKGRASYVLADDAALGNRNALFSTQLHVRKHPVRLRLGRFTKLTSGHYIELGESITFGDYSLLAGIGSQLWTHGYVHMATGLERALVRGTISVGSNVYIGSLSCIGPGVEIADGVSVGAHSSVAKSLLQPGVYVSQSLRFVPQSPEQRLANLVECAPPEGHTRHYWRGAQPGRPRLPKPLHRAGQAAPATGRLQ